MLTQALDYDPIAGYDDPYPVYRRLRAEAPLYHNPERGFWALTRFADVQEAARDWATYSSSAGVDLDDTGKLFSPGGFADLDPPDHDRLRAILRDAFTPRAVARLEPKVRAKVRSLLDALAGRREADLVAELARPLPAAIVCDLLGFPSQDHAHLDDWNVAMQKRIPGEVELRESVWEAYRHYRGYVEEAAAQRMEHPGDDLLSRLVASEQAGSLSHEELLGLAVFLFFASTNTVTGLIGYSLLWLDRFPQERAKLVGEPARSAAAVEELSRFDAPIQWLKRVTTRPVELHGEVIPKGEHVLLVWGAANRDESRFADPDRLDFDRPPSRHMSFGEGIHFCLGAPLARLAGRVVLEEVLARFPGYSVSGTAVRAHAPGERILGSLPVSL